MTDHQKEALQKAFRILAEHFDSSVVIVNFEVLGRDASGTDFYYSGGAINALGAMRLSHDRLLARMTDAHKNYDKDRYPEA